MEPTRIGLATSWMLIKRSPSWAMAPYLVLKGRIERPSNDYKSIVLPLNYKSIFWPGWLVQKPKFCDVEISTGSNYGRKGRNRTYVHWFRASKPSTNRLLDISGRKCVNRTHVHGLQSRKPTTDRTLDVIGVLPRSRFPGWNYLWRLYWASIVLLTPSLINSQIVFNNLSITYLLTAHVWSFKRQ